MPALNIKCPHCLESIDLVQHLRQTNQAQLMLVLGGFGADWQLVWEYLMLFRASPGRLPLKAMTAAARQLSEVWQGGWFAHRKQSYRIERTALIQALTKLVDYPPSQRPNLRNNNYLWAMLLPVAKEQRRQAAKAETRAEETKRSAPPQDGRRRGDPAALGDLMGGLMQRAAQPTLSPAEIDELAKIAREYSEVCVRVMIEKKETRMDKLCDLENQVRAAGMDIQQLIKLARAETVPNLTDAQLLKELGLKVEGGQA